MATICDVCSGGGVAVAAGNEAAFASFRFREDLSDDLFCFRDLLVVVVVLSSPPDGELTCRFES